MTGVYSDDIEADVPLCCRTWASSSSTDVAHCCRTRAYSSSSDAVVALCCRTGAYFWLLPEFSEHEHFISDCVSGTYWNGSRVEMKNIQRMY